MEHGAYFSPLLFVAPSDLGDEEWEWLAHEIGLDAVLKIITIAGGHRIFMYRSPSSDHPYPEGSLRRRIEEAIGSRRMRRLERLVGNTAIYVPSIRSVLRRAARRLYRLGEPPEMLAWTLGISAQEIGYRPERI